eukprot:15146074-Alexandrium_andersonii.AAC.1
MTNLKRLAWLSVLSSPFDDVVARCFELSGMQTQPSAAARFAEFDESGGASPFVTELPCCFKLAVET